MEFSCFKSKNILFVLYVIAFLQLGCRENILINSKVSPTNDTLGVFQQFLPCITHTYFDNAIISSYSFPGIPIYQPIGSFLDPFFGEQTGSTFFQVIPANLGFTFAATDTIDSAILVLPYSGYTYGDTSNSNFTQSYQVFYVTDSMGNVSTSSYYVNSDKAIDSKLPLCKPTSVNLYHLKDSISITGKHAAGLRLKLDTAHLMSYLRPAIANSVIGGVPSQQSFINSFNGVCVRVADTRNTVGALPYFRLDGSDPYSEAGILVYYHSFPGDTSYQQFYFNSSYCTHFSKINSSFSRSPVNSLYQSKNQCDSIIALQNQPGAGIDVVIYGISTLRKGIINKAELEISLLKNANYYNSGKYYAPEKLYPTGITTSTYPLGNTQGEIYNIADRYPIYSVSPFGIIDGYSHVFNGNITTYTINLPRELMVAISQKSDTIHLHINGTEDFLGATHLIAGGGNYPDSSYRTRLKVVYSQLLNQ